VTEIREINTWFTLPKWTRAHEIEQYGSLGYIRLWVTACGRDYQTPDPEYDDAPITAPADMPRCGNCLRLQEQRIERPLLSWLDEYSGPLPWANIPCRACGECELAKYVGTDCTPTDFVCMACGDIQKVEARA
jgi:hypothetical protein